MLEQGVQQKFIEPSLQKWGCYWFCLVRWAQELGLKDLDDPALLRMFERHKQRGWIEDDCFVVNPMAILNDIQHEETFTTVERTGIVPDEPIFVVYLKKPGHNHFVLSMRGERWDPCDPDRPGVNDYKIDSYRWIR